MKHTNSDSADNRPIIASSSKCRHVHVHVMECEGRERQVNEENASSVRGIGVKRRGSVASDCCVLVEQVECAARKQENV